jgi:hypothetical protein
MTDQDTKIRSLLHELAEEAEARPVMARPTLGRARRRRATVVALSLIVLAGTIVATATAIRNVGRHGVPANRVSRPAPTPSVIAPRPGTTTAPSAAANPSPSPSGPFATDVADGRSIVFAKSVVTTTDPTSLRFDLAQFLTGDAANQYAAAHGMETPVPNDNLIVNENPRLRLMPLAPDVTIRVINWTNGCTDASGVCGPNETIDLDAFATLLRAKPFADGIHIGSGAPYWLTIRGGVIVAIEEQYQP